MISDGYYIVSYSVSNDLLLIGKIKDETEVKDISKVLSYFYPFRCKIEKEKVTCYNIEDFLFLEKIFKVDLIFSFFGENNKGKKVYCFLSPQIVKINNREITKIETVIEKKEENIDCEQVALVFPYFNPYDRGRILDEVLKKKHTSIVLPGYFIGKNKDSLSTLSCRYLLKNKQPYSSILKVKTSQKIEDILLESIEVLNLMVDSPKGVFTKIRIYCTCHDVCRIQKRIRILRREGSFQKIKFLYFVLD